MRQILKADGWNTCTKISLRGSALGWHFEIMGDDGVESDWKSLSVSGPAFHSSYVGHTLPFMMSIHAEARSGQEHDYTLAINAINPVEGANAPAIRLFPIGNTGLFVRVGSEWLETHSELLPMAEMAQAFLNVVASPHRPLALETLVALPDAVGVMVCSESGEFVVVPVKAYLSCLVRGDRYLDIPHRILRSGLVHRESLIESFKEYV